MFVVRRKEVLPDLHCRVKARRSQVEKLLRDAEAITTLSQEERQWGWLYRERDDCYHRIDELEVCGLGLGLAVRVRGHFILVCLLVLQAQLRTAAPLPDFLEALAPERTFTVRHRCVGGWRYC